MALHPKLRLCSAFFLLSPSCSLNRSSNFSHDFFLFRFVCEWTQLSCAPFVNFRVSEKWLGSGAMCSPRSRTHTHFIFAEIDCVSAIINILSDSDVSTDGRCCEHGQKGRDCIAKIWVNGIMSNNRIDRTHNRFWRLLHRGGNGAATLDGKLINNIWRTDAMT